ncbi:MAG TPA: hypothetical protein VGP91_18065 [Actinoplanes sp.]|jgi:hypothetical protein|nr:hypothetical protein [Actinoplanes sp.]
MTWRPDYTTAVALKAEILKTASAVDDAWIGLVVTAASRAIDRHTLRQFGRVATAETRYYPATYRSERSRWVVTIDDLMSTEAAEVAVTLDGVAVTGAVLLPRNAAAEGKPWTQIQLPEGTWPTDTEVSVLERWGWLAVPSAITAAALLQASRFYNRKDSPYGITPALDAAGALRLLQRVDPDVGVMLTDYVRPGGVA